jgi:hypothetical protein
MVGSSRSEAFGLVRSPRATAAECRRPPTSSSFIMELNRRRANRNIGSSGMKHSALMGRGASKGLLLLLLALVALSLFSGAVSASAAITQTQVSSANGEIQSAFTSAYAAEKSGGNVTSLTAELNEAVQLVQKAMAENATSPAQASVDLANATLIAQGVVSAAGPVGQQGAANRQSQVYLSTGSAAVIIAVAALIYAFGDRIFHRIWLLLYGNYVVSKIG